MLLACLSVTCVHMVIELLTVPVRFLCYSSFLFAICTLSSFLVSSQMQTVLLYMKRLYKTESPIFVHLRVLFVSLYYHKFVCHATEFDLDLFANSA